MIIFKDIISNDEIISDSFPMKEVDGVAYECDCAMITLDAVQVDIGANASAEEADEALDDTAVRVNNIVNSFRLQETSIDKKSYLSHLKAYMKRVKQELQQRGADAETVSEFETKAQAFAKKILSEFKNYEFYTGESMNPDGMIILLNYREDGITPFITIWKHGLVEMKL